MKVILRNKYKLLDSPTGSLIIVAASYLLFIAIRLSTHGFDPSTFVTAGDKFCNESLAPSSLKIMKGSGYDGQFYYRLALDPFTSKRTDFGITLDNPAYRQQRILYPLVTWLTSLGRPEVIPIMMITVNFLALCLMAWMGACFAQSAGRHALWGLFFPLYPGFLLSLSRDTTEILETAFLMLSLWMIKKERVGLATLFISLAVLTKETAILLAGALFCNFIYESTIKKTQTQTKWYVSVIPIILFVLWQWFLFQHWGKLPLLQNTGSIGWPFYGLFCFIKSLISFDRLVQIFWFIEVILVICFAIGATLILRSSTASRYEKMGWIFYALLAVLFTQVLWIEDWGFFRALPEFWVLGTLILISSKSRLKAPIFSFSILIWMLLAIQKIIQ